MQKHMVTAILVVSLAFSFAGCKKEEQKPQLPAGHPGMEGGMPQMGMQSVPKIDRKVVVSKEVKTMWKAVKLAVDDKAKKSTKEYTVNVGSDLAIPGTNVTVKVLAFLPHFMMGDTEITSASDKPVNPAAQVVITENGKELWKGWLYSLHPEIHPFEHQKLGIKLAGGTAK